MASYRVSFFKNLLSSDGHCFRCLQDQLEVRDQESPAQAAESAARSFAALQGVRDWRLIADEVEVAPAEREDRSLRPAG